MPAKSTDPKTFDYRVAKNVLSQNEKERLVCLFLHADQKSIDWAKATEQFDCKSVDSMKVMVRTALKKVTEAQANGGAVASASPVKGGKAGGGKKRKAAAAAAEDGDDEEEAKPAVKKGKGGAGRKGKVDSPVEEEDEMGIKVGGGDEGDFVM